MNCAWRRRLEFVFNLKAQRAQPSNSGLSYSHPPRDARSKSRFLPSGSWVSAMGGRALEARIMQSLIQGGPDEGDASTRDSTQGSEWIESSVRVYVSQVCSAAGSAWISPQFSAEAAQKRISGGGILHDVR